MDVVRFIGCLHLGHPNMHRHRGFDPTDGSHDEYLIEQWNKVVGRKDITYILGDVTMEKNAHFYMLDRLNGVKHVVLGNHDRRQDVRELLNYVDTVGGMVEYKGYALTHCPIHPNEVVFYKGNIHAHIHHVNKLEEVKVFESYRDTKVIVNTKHKYYNVDAKLIDFRPRTLEELISDG